MVPDKCSDLLCVHVGVAGEEPGRDEPWGKLEVGKPEGVKPGEGKPGKKPGWKLGGTRRGPREEPRVYAWGNEAQANLFSVSRGMLLLVLPSPEQLAEATSTVWNLVDVIQFLFDGDWLDFRICPKSAASRTAYWYSHRGTLVRETWVRRLSDWGVHQVTLSL